MQYDMHYYATYVMAAAAGIPQADAEIIATSAQFVDDQNITAWVLGESEEGILGTATAHHPLEAGIRTFFGDSASNDTRPVWVPFHFLPGAEGNSFHEKMICQKNSVVANKMLDHYIKPETIQAHKEHALHLMGIAAHVYADTFSHYGFSGFKTSLNQVDLESIYYNDSHSSEIISYIEKKKNEFLGSFTQAAELGHGAVLTNPDRPYLKWSFTYEDGRRSERNNQATFLEACQALYERFSQFANVYYEEPPQPLISWEAMKSTIATILAKEASADDRAKAWMSAMKKSKKGPLSDIPTCRIYDNNMWLIETENFRDTSNTADFIKSNPYRFFVAADYHRSYVLKRLLPEVGLMVA